MRKAQRSAETVQFPLTLRRKLIGNSASTSILFSILSEIISFPGEQPMVRFEGGLGDRGQRGSGMLREPPGD